jgi:DnaJ family protein A protein 5
MEFSQDQDSDFEIPDFGNSNSDYTEVDKGYKSTKFCDLWNKIYHFKVVRTFYAYWSAYCTLRPFSWLDKYNIDTLKEVPRRYSSQL